MNIKSTAETILAFLTLLMGSGGGAALYFNRKNRRAEAQKTEAETGKVEAETDKTEADAELTQANAVATVRKSEADFFTSAAGTMHQLMEQNQALFATQARMQGQLIELTDTVAEMQRKLRDRDERIDYFTSENEQLRRTIESLVEKNDLQRQESEQREAELTGQVAQLRTELDELKRRYELEGSHATL